MKRFVVLQKNIGETPLSAIQAWREHNPVYKDVRASYAGRLDPMASGKLLVLLGDECKRQHAYTQLDKEYEIEVLLDLSSDTGDALGLVEYSKVERYPDRDTLARTLEEECGTHRRPYPAFSSKTVNGKPLFLHALEGSLSGLILPTHIERIYTIRKEKITTVSNKELEVRILKFLTLVPRTLEPSKKLGDDFRVDAIRARWESIFKKTEGKSFTILRLCVICASGTYMRTFAGRIGNALGTSALALTITRTKIGTYKHLFKHVGWWSRTY